MTHISGDPINDAAYDDGVYADIPIITDAVVVVADDDDDDAERPPILPPAVNPNYAISPSAPSPMVATAMTTTVMVDPGGRGLQQNAVVPYSAPATAKIMTELGRNPAGLICPHCGRQTVTTVRDVVGLGTVVAVIVVACLFWPLCWLPFVVPSCKRTHHFCGHAECRRRLGETRVCA